MKCVRDIEYDRGRLCDVYLPDGEAPFPVVIWLHAGGWRFGDRRSAPDLVQYYAADGYAMVSIDYRLSGEAKFPAQVEDVKTAVRWVRAEASRYGFDPARVGLWGSSAGGHLAAIAAFSPAGSFESADCAYPEHSSAVQAVVDCYGPVDFLKLDEHRAEAAAHYGGAGSKWKANAADSFESRLIGGPIQEFPERARVANPAAWVSESVPPVLMVHGAEDMDVPAAQSELLYHELVIRRARAAIWLFSGLGHCFLESGAPARDCVKREYRPGCGERVSRSVSTPYDIIGRFLAESFSR